MIARLFRNNNPQPALSREAHLSYCRQCTGRFQTCPYRLLLLLALLTATFPAFAQTPDLTVCAGKGFTLTSVAGAVGASGGVTYTWYESVNGTDASTIPNSNVAFISIPEGKATAGTYAYVRKASNAECPGGVFSNTYTVVVYAIPTITTQPTPSSSICAGSTVTLSVIATDATAYQWKDIDGADVTAGNGGTSANYTTEALGANATYSVVVSNGISACSTTSNIALVAVSALPEVSSVSASTVCAGKTTVLTATVSGGTTSSMTYTWNIGGSTSTTPASTITTQQLSNNTAFTVTVKNSNGCTSAQKAGTITVTSGAAQGSDANACGCASGKACYGKCVASDEYCQAPQCSVCPHGKLLQGGTGSCEDYAPTCARAAAFRGGSCYCLEPGATTYPQCFCYTDY